MVYEGGIKGLWRGNGMNILKVVPESAIKFTVYEAVKKLIKSESSHENLSIYERFCAGAVAGGVSQTVVYPLDVMKTRLALGKTGQYNGIIKAVFKMYETKGMRSFYRGYLPNILGILPYAGIELAVYETLKKRYLTKHSKTHQESMLSTLGCGVAASIVGQVFTYPLALVRTRLQAKGKNLWSLSTNINILIIYFSCSLFNGWRIQIHFAKGWHFWIIQRHYTKFY